MERVVPGCVPSMKSPFGFLQSGHISSTRSSLLVLMGTSEGPLDDEEGEGGGDEGGAPASAIVGESLRCTSSSSNNNSGGNRKSTKTVKTIEVLLALLASYVWRCCRYYGTSSKEKMCFSAHPTGKRKGKS
jgi:hypothetical protein